MRTNRWTTRAVARMVTAFMAVGVMACSDGEGEDEPEIEQIRLMIGAQEFTSVGGNPPSTAVVLSRGTHNVTVTALTGNGGTITLGADFELRITSTNTAVASYTKVSAFAGTLNAASAGSAVLNVQLFHLGEGHPDYEILRLPITVR